MRQCEGGLHFISNDTHPVFNPRKQVNRSRIRGLKRKGVGEGKGEGSSRPRGEAEKWVMSSLFRRGGRTRYNLFPFAFG